MRLAIIGHSPKMKDTQNGEDIDAHDYVMRMKCSKHLLDQPSRYGTKTTHVVGSLVIAKELHHHWGDDVQYYLFVDTRTEHASKPVIDAITREFKDVTVNPELCHFWISAYRQNRKPMTLDDRQEVKENLSDELGHRHYSAGMAAIIHGIDYLRPDEITLYGFDNILTGTFDYSVTRGKEYEKYPDHHFKAENDLLDMVCCYYNYTLKGNMLHKR